jgi:hypothetical protein
VRKKKFKTERGNALLRRKTTKFFCQMEAHKKKKKKRNKFWTASSNCFRSCFISNSRAKTPSNVALNAYNSATCMPASGGKTSGLAIPAPGLHKPSSESSGLDRAIVEIRSPPGGGDPRRLALETRPEFPPVVATRLNVGRFFSVSFSVLRSSGSSFELTRSTAGAEISREKAGGALDKETVVESQSSVMATAGASNTDESKREKSSKTGEGGGKFDTGDCSAVFVSFFTSNSESESVSSETTILEGGTGEPSTELKTDAVVEARSDTGDGGATGKTVLFGVTGGLGEGDRGG